MSVEALEHGLVAEAPESGWLARAGVLRRLLRDRVAALAASALVIIVMGAIFAPWIAPYDITPIRRTGGPALPGPP